jgi:hypothetical protein
MQISARGKKKGKNATTKKLRHEEVEKATEASSDGEFKEILNINGASSRFD